MTTTFLLIRHAAHGLLGRVLAGRTGGVHLSEEGRAQADRLAGRLGGEGIRLVQSSPMERAHETAAPIAAALGLEVEVAPALDEIDFGAWTGLGFDELDGDAGWTRWNTARGFARPPEGESAVEVLARLLAHVEALRERHPDETVALVSHCDVIRALLLHALGLPAEAYGRIEIAPASISRLVLGDWGARVEGLNERVGP